MGDESTRDRYEIRTLGEPTVASPLGLSGERREVSAYIPEGTRILEAIELGTGETVAVDRALEKAGPRERIFFEPQRTSAAILTAGGICPGINDVIRSLVLELVHAYGVRSVLGIRYGFAGLARSPGEKSEPVPLGLEQVRHIHRFGGTVLGTSRGGHDPAVMVEALLARGVSILFVIGGDGSMRGAHAIAEEALRRGAPLSVVGVPKTIDNDIPFVDKTFGFETAVAMARTAIDAAHTEALSVRNGIGLVKLMGRHAGFIAASAAMASHDVNVCLVPEVPFRLDGPTGVLAYLERRLAARSHAVVVVAEGCGEQLLAAGGARVAAPRDASGNLSFTAPELDIGTYLREAITRHFDELAASTGEDARATLKYIDPSYMLRGVPAGAIDAAFCADLARHAVHAAMAGKTDMMVGRLHRAFTHVPLPLVASAKKRIDPNGGLWLAVTETTGQPPFAPPPRARTPCR